MLENAYLEFRVTCPMEAQDAVSSFLWDNNAQGITEESTARAGRPFVRLRAYFEHQAAEGLEARIATYLQSIEPFFPETHHARVSVRTVEEKDWNAAWKEGFKPLKVSPRLIIRPSWEPYSSREGEIVIDIDPGMAFGTGTHETTRGCLRAIDAIFGAPGDTAVPARPDTKSVLDVGTGSGILLIAALALGAEAGVGIDIDPLAVETATDNCTINGVGPRVRIANTPLEEIPGRFDLVLANILASTLTELAPQLAERLETGGTLVLSGLLEDQAGYVQAAFEAQGLQPVASIREGEWMTLVFRGSPG